MGIPVDGTVAEMKAKLMAKGFKELSIGNDTLLQGRFNDSNVFAAPLENNGKVYRVLVSNMEPFSETDVRIAYNNLCYQFCKNPKYSTLKEESDYMIPDSENISYEITVHNKSYEAAFVQLDSISAQKIYSDALLSKYTIEQIQNPTTQQREEMRKLGTEALNEVTHKKIVWFRIKRMSYEQYSIALYYDNGYNMSNGEDL